VLAASGHRPRQPLLLTKFAILISLFGHSGTDSDQDETSQCQGEHIHIGALSYRASESSTLRAHAYNLVCQERIRAPIGIASRITKFPPHTRRESGSVAAFDPVKSCKTSVFAREASHSAHCLCVTRVRRSHYSEILRCGPASPRFGRRILNCVAVSDLHPRRFLNSVQFSF
jgi:hypothetical protein